MLIVTSTVPKMVGLQPPKGIMSISWIVLVVISIVSSQYPKIKLLEPKQSSVYAVREVSQTISLAIIYKIEIFSDPTVISSQVCLRVNNADSEELLLQSTCFDIEEGKVQKNLDGVGAGNFIVSLEILDHHLKIVERATSLFHVKEKRFLIPEIRMLHPSLSPAVMAGNEKQENEIIVVASESVGAKFTDLLVDFTLSASLLLESDYEICAHVTELHSGAKIMTLSCVSPRQKSIEIKSLPIGNYALSLALYDTNMDNDTVLSRIYTNSMVKTLVHVKALNDLNMMPSLDVGFEVRELGVASSEHISDYEVKCPVTGVHSAVHQLLVCLEVQHLKSRAFKIDEKLTYSGNLSEGENSIGFKSLIPLTCLARNKYSFSIRGITTGLYKIKLILRLANSPHTYYEATEKTIKLEVRDYVEMTPTYDWQMLHAWHTIPSGLETRLPLSSEGRKEARIPEFWQLQLTMPHPCKYFLRMTVSRFTTIGDILNAAGKQCKMEPSSFILTADGKGLLDVGENVESVNYFNVKHGLLLRDEQQSNRIH